ncbi:hypothetical protein CTAYLR_006900 [Chrysophaeum taylorii]|uniref:Uncharacterized protein n=1 Tax=Chrysophaeum taylorii TaxID=2483200 RepID=A0AAD7UFR8_9STRA|nr:hypothetical protein CTAYLR_006900 [Chrysophaeum taylorii]
MRRAASKARMNMNNILLALGRRVPSEHTIPRQPPVDDVALSRAANHNYAVVQATPTDDDDDDDYDDARETTTRAVRTPAARPRRQAESGDHESHLFTPAARRRRAEPVGREDHGSTAAHPRQKEPRLEVSARSRADLMLHIRAPPAHEPNDEPHPMNEARNDAPVPDSSDEVNVPPRSAPTHHPPWIGNDAVAPEEETRQREEPLHDQVEQTMKNARAVPRAEDDRNEPETIEPTEVPPRPTYGQTRHHRRDDQCPLTTTNIQTSSESADEQPAVQSSRDSRLSANPGNRLRKRRRQGPSETTPRVTQNITRTLICSCNGAGCDICGGRRNVPRVEAVPLVDSPPMTPEMTEKEMMDLESLSVMRLKQHADRLGVEPDDDPRQKHTWITAIRRAVARETTTSNASTAISPETASRTEPNLPVNVPSQHNDHATTSGGGAAAATSTRVPASLATQRVDETPPHRSVPDSADEGETARRDASDDRDNEQLVAKTPCAEATVEALPLVTPNATGQPADERDDDDSSRTSTQHDEEAVVPPPAYKASYPGALIDGGVLDITGFAELFGNISNEQTLQSAIAAAKSAWQNPRCRRGWEVLEAATQPQANDAARDVYKMSRAVLMLLQFADHVNHATKSREVGRTRNGC